MMTFGKHVYICAVVALYPSRILSLVSAQFSVVYSFEQVWTGYEADMLNGLFNILIRHGAYISVYCNLASASVKQGDTVTTKQTIGQVFSDGADNGRTVLHFQLRKEKEKLNPEPWLNR